jgi:hypothetical protein
MEGLIMRILMVVLLAAVPLIPLLNAQAEGSDDPYSLGMVSFELKMNSGGRRMIHSWSQKRLVQLGDGVSIALLKILGPDELKNPARVKEYTPIIRTCFTQPELISLETNRNPRITLFLLDHLRQDIQDPATQELIRQTEEFVKQKTAKQNRED